MKLFVAYIDIYMYFISAQLTDTIYADRIRHQLLLDNYCPASQRQSLRSPHQSWTPRQ